MMYDKTMKRGMDKVEISKEKNESHHGNSLPLATQSSSIYSERYPTSSNMPWSTVPNNNPTSFGMMQQRLPAPQLFQASSKNPFHSDQSQVCLPRLMEHQVNRRSRHFVPSSRKDEYYWVKRQKNNEAARKSREKRRINDIMLEKKVLQLVQENLQLKKDLLAVKVKYNEIDHVQLQEIMKQIEEPIPHLFTHMKEEARIMEKGNKLKEEGMQFYADQSFLRFSAPKGELEGKGCHARVISCTTQDAVSAMIVKDERCDALEAVPFPVRNETDTSGRQLAPPPYDTSVMSSSRGMKDQELALALKLVTNGQTNGFSYPPAAPTDLQPQENPRRPESASPRPSLNLRNESNEIPYAVLMALQNKLFNSKDFANGLSSSQMEHFHPMSRKASTSAQKDLCPVGGCHPGTSIAGPRHQEDAVLALTSLWQNRDGRSKTNRVFNPQTGTMELNGDGESEGATRENCGSNNSRTSSSSENDKHASDQVNPLTPDSDGNTESSSSIDSYSQSSPDQQDMTSDRSKSSSDNQASNDSSGSESGSSFSPVFSSSQEETPEEKSHRLPYKLRFKLAASSCAS